MCVNMHGDTACKTIKVHNFLDIPIALPLYVLLCISVSLFDAWD